MNNDYEKFELRICLIGEDYVGKKSIINRFRTIKSTETLEYPVKPKIHSIIDQNKNENSKQKNQRRLQSEETPIIIPKLKHKLENLTNFTKVFRIERNHLELKFFNIPAAEKINFSDNLGDDDEVEKIHKIRFTNIKNTFSNIIAKKSESYLPVHYLLIFVFDITNTHSLEKIKVYYEEITKHIHFDKSYFRILIGNKIDLKVPYEQIDRDMLDSFVASKGLNYYEISAKLYFNFTDFFEKMFFGCFESTFPAFSEEIFKIRLNNCLRTTTTIPKELRNKTFTVNDIPGPQKYNPNVYDMTIKEGILLFDF
jgi:GTPase SAR1 family protein